MVCEFVKRLFVEDKARDVTLEVSSISLTLLYTISQSAKSSNMSGQCLDPGCQCGAGQEVSVCR